MLALEPHIKARLQALPALASWAVHGGTDLVDRRTAPMADVRCTGAQTKDSEATAVTVDPAWTVTLVVARGDWAAQQLDDALKEVIGSLHNWRPGQVDGDAGQLWRRMALATVREPAFVPEGMAGLEIIFVTSTVYHGQVLR